MITRLADILRELQTREAVELSRQGITHPPTIGEMYEGLTRDLLDRAIPASAGLQIVDGFVVAPDGHLSPQIDCMLVKGEGTSIPYTSHYKWPVKDVIAVFEFKKNLYVAELNDSYMKLRAVLDSYSKWVDSVADSEEAPDVRPAFQAFATLTGLYPRNYHDAHELPEPLQHIFHVLVMEHVSPVRVVFGYEGFVDEYGLREGFVKFLNKYGAEKPGFGVGSLPTLVICGGNSIVKMNGQPYITSWTASGWWKALASNCENPLRLLLELIWTRLCHVIDMAMPPDDTLQEESLHLLLSARVVRRNEHLGWEYHYTQASKEELEASTPALEWEPIRIDTNEVVFLNMLAINGALELSDEPFLKWAGDEQIDVDSFIDRLTETRIVARTGSAVRLVWPTLFTGFTPDGQALAATDAARFGLWQTEWMAHHRSSAKS